jgi:hypothetical protein
MSAGCSTGVSGARVREMVINLTAHPIYLLVDCGGQFVLTFDFRPIRFLCENCERSFQAVSQVTSFCERPLHSFFSLIKQQIQIIDEWLNFSGVSSFDLALLAVTNRRQSRAELAERQQAAADLRKSANEKNERKEEQCSSQSNMDNSHKARTPTTAEYHEEHVADRKQAERPENCAKKDAQSKRAGPHHGVALMR